MEKNFLNYNTIKPIDNTDENVKKTGYGWHSGEYKLLAGLTYGIFLNSSIAQGRIKTIDSGKAIKIPGVLVILTHLNQPGISTGKLSSKAAGEPGTDKERFRLFYDDRIEFYQQPVALVIAESFEAAVIAARLVKISYLKENHRTGFAAHRVDEIKVKYAESYIRRASGEIQSSQVKIETGYSTSLQVSGSMEMHAAVVVWDARNEMTDSNKIDAVKAVKKNITAQFKLKEENVKVHFSPAGDSPELFSKLLPQEMAAIIGAKKTGRPLLVMASRSLVFSMFDYRPSSIQNVGLTTTMDGLINDVTHEIIVNTFAYDEATTPITDATKSLYACENIHTINKVAQLNITPPGWTKDAGKTSNSFALESAIDELSYVLSMDPIELRLKNFAEQDPQSGLPWSSNHLKECFHLGIKSSSWLSRNPKPCSMHSEDWLLGMGMSAGICKAGHLTESATATFGTNGRLIIQCSVADKTPAAINILTQVAANAFNMDVSDVEIIPADPVSPETHGQIGLHTVNPDALIYGVVEDLQIKIKEIAVINHGTLLSGKKTGELIIEKGILICKNTGASLPVTDLLKQHNLPAVKATLESNRGSEQQKFSFKSFCAHFVEVLVNPYTGKIKVKKVVTAVDAGKIINLKAAAMQVRDSIINGLGISLVDQSFIDNGYSLYINNHHADYMSLSADMPLIEIIFVNKPDPLNSTGFKGVDEIGMVGLPAAVANAVYHATGKRIRSLPIRLDI